MSGSGSTPTKPVPAPRRGSKLKEPSASDKLQNFKTQFGNFMSGWISSENVFVAPTRKGDTLPKLADLLKTELFVVLEEGESFSTRVFSPCGTKVRNCAAMLSQIREKLNTPTDNEQLLRLKRMSKSPHSNPLLRDLAFLLSIRENLSILLKTVTSWAQRDKTLQEKVTFMDTKKIAQNYADPGGTLEKLNNLKPLISGNEELYIS